MSDAEQVVKDFLVHLEVSDFDKGRLVFAEAIAEDCRWANSGFPTAEGKDACLALWDAFHQASGFVGLRVDMIAIGSAGDTVVTERVDHLLNSAGEVIVSIPLAGTLVVRAGKIAAWRDYFDPRPLLG
ncbi:MAG TPA: limonene-1,2-epoxide hydrolase family protein [Sporichthyaceae bacterium]|nr:limonene-1,2-epoxide hydrolase family protein [Sporichthyaceae bacterium]